MEPSPFLRDRQFRHRKHPHPRNTRPAVRRWPDPLPPRRRVGLTPTLPEFACSDPQRIRTNVYRLLWAIQPSARQFGRAGDFPKSSISLRPLRPHAAASRCWEEKRSSPVEHVRAEVRDFSGPDDRHPPIELPMAARAKSARPRPKIAKLLRSDASSEARGPVSCSAPKT